MGTLPRPLPTPEARMVHRTAVDWLPLALLRLLHGVSSIRLRWLLQGGVSPSDAGATAGGYRCLHTFRDNVRYSRMARCIQAAVVNKTTWPQQQVRWTRGS